LYIITIILIANINAIMRFTIRDFRKNIYRSSELAENTKWREMPSEPYLHTMQVNDYLVTYVWDTREIVHIIRLTVSPKKAKNIAVANDNCEPLKDPMDILPKELEWLTI
jgi:hypothetical protein